MKNENINTLTDWDSFKHTLGITLDEWDEIDLKVKIISEVIAAQQSQDITQQALETLSGVRQPVITWFEDNISDLRLTTILEVLRPLGKTLAIVPMEEKYVGNM